MKVSIYILRVCLLKKPSPLEEKKFSLVDEHHEGGPRRMYVIFPAEEVVELTLGGIVPQYNLQYQGQNGIELGEHDHNLQGYQPSGRASRIELGYKLQFTMYELLQDLVVRRPFQERITGNK
ncbi:hypothetical protein C0J52_13167 [Blattella germanica]|nr:hypothetical protein C0J52_13167 [Blattella germanica]